MALQLGTLRDALIEAGVSADKAGDAAAEVVEYASRLAGTTPRITALTWIVGAIFALNLLILSSLFGVWSRLIEVGDQVTHTAVAALR
jgi:hypothetical protein